MLKVESWSLSIYFALIFLLTILVYWSGLDGIFLVDDTYNLNALNAKGGVTDWDSFILFVFGNNSGMLGRPVAMLSFLIDDQYYPGSVESYRYTNLMIHCLCGVFVFLVSRKLTFIVSGKGDNFSIQVALISSLWWLLAPINVSTTLYIIQRMTQLSTLFCLIGLLVFLCGRQAISKNDLRGRILVVIGLYFFGALAVLSKENGALIFCYAWVFELAVCYSRKQKSDNFVLCALSAPLIFAFFYVLVKWTGLTFSSVREFTTTERLMTESRILCDYLIKIIFPVSRGMGLIHDDIIISKGMLSPISTIVSMTFNVGLIAASIYYRKRHVWLFIAVLGFFVGHSLESTVIPLELYFEHRNYMPSIFVFMGLSAISWSFIRARWFFRGVVLLMICSATIFCYQRASIWGNPKAQISIWAMEHPESIRAQTMYARSLIAEKNYPAAEIELARLRKKWPRYIHNDLVVLNQSCVRNMQSVFTTEELYKRVEHGLYDGSLPSILEETFRLYKVKACPLLSDSFMLGLFERIWLLEKNAHTFRAKLAFWEFELFALKGDLGGAIVSLDKTFRYQKTGYVLFVKSGVLFSAGLNELALVEIKKAIILEQSKSFFTSVNMENFQMLESNIKRALLHSKD